MARPRLLASHRLPTNTDSDSKPTGTRKTKTISVFPSHRRLIARTSLLNFIVQVACNVPLDHLQRPHYFSNTSQRLFLESVQLCSSCPVLNIFQTPRSFLVESISLRSTMLFPKWSGHHHDLGKCFHYLPDPLDRKIQTGAFEDYTWHNFRYFGLLKAQGERYVIN